MCQKVIIINIIVYCHLLLYSVMFCCEDQTWSLLYIKIPTLSSCGNVVHIRYICTSVYLMYHHPRKYYFYMLGHMVKGGSDQQWKWPSGLILCFMNLMRSTNWTRCTLGVFTLSKRAEEAPSTFLSSSEGGKRTCESHKVTLEKRRYLDSTAKAGWWRQWVNWLTEFGSVWE